MDSNQMILDNKSQARQLHFLLSLHDADFVKQSYLYILGRAVDPDGLEYSVSRLRAGFSKLTMLRDMRRSPEGRQVSKKLDKLDRLLRFHHLCNLPFAGFLFRLFRPHESDQPAERYLRAILNELGRVRGELAPLPMVVAHPISGSAEDREADKRSVMSYLGSHERRIFSHLAAQFPA